MEVTLPSGATVQLRDKLTAGDKFEVQDSMSFSLDTNTGLQETAGGIINAMRNALLKRIIESWSFTLPLPGKSDSLDELDIDDYNALADAVEPMLLKVLNQESKTGGAKRPNPRRRSSS